MISDFRFMMYSLFRNVTERPLRSTIRDKQNTIHHSEERKKLFFFPRPSSLVLRPSLMLFVLCLLSFYTMAQQERKPVRDGNELYQKQKYDDAEKKYDEALAVKPNLLEGIYNKANVQYQKKDYENAAKQYETAAALSNEPLVKAKAYHNMGNALLEAKKYKESVEAYKNALRLNPNDADTKYNLAYALQKLKQQASQSKSNNQNNNEEPSEYAKKLKKMSDELVAKRKYVDAFNLMNEGLKKDKSVATYQAYINRIKDVAQIDK
jgi:Ca-activated chloride channel homolog